MGGGTWSEPALTLQFPESLPAERMLPALPMGVFFGCVFGLALRDRLGVGLGAFIGGNFHRPRALGSFSISRNLSWAWGPEGVDLEIVMSALLSQAPQLRCIDGQPPA